MCDKRIDPFAYVYTRCNDGTLRSKITTMPTFPRLVDIELAHVCYLQCKMCPVGARFGKRPPSRMSLDMAKKIIDECTSHRTPVRFIGWGEPTESDIWKEATKYAHDAGILVHMNTNGQWWNPAIDFQYVDSLKFSMQGYNFDEYHTIRRGASFSRLVHNIFRIRNTFPDLYITVGTTVSALDDAQGVLFRKFWTETGVDKITIDLTRDLVAPRNYVSRVRTAPTPPNCPELWSRLTVQADGGVTPCCSDYDGDMIVGHIEKSSLQDVWNSWELDTLRHSFLINNGTCYAPCRRCTL